MEEQKMCEAAAKAAATEERKHAVAVNAERWVEYALYPIMMNVSHVQYVYRNELFERYFSKNRIAYVIK